MSVMNTVSGEGLAELKRLASRAVRDGDKGVGVVPAADLLSLCREVSTLRRHMARLSEAGWGAVDAMQATIEAADLADDEGHDLYHPQQALRGSLELTEGD